MKKYSSDIFTSYGLGSNMISLLGIKPGSLITDGDLDLGRRLEAVERPLERREVVADRDLDLERRGGVVA